MTGLVRVVVTVVVFTTMLVLVVARPRGWHEAWWALLGAVAMLVLGLVTPHDAAAAILDGKNALLFLLSLLALSLLIGKSGFFDWAAIRCARTAKGNGRSLYRNTFVLGAIVTIALSLDTTAVILTPIVLAMAKKLKLPVAPYVVLCAFVANTGSLLLPISNLTNLLFADSFHLSFTAFAVRTIGPQLVALVITYALLRWQFRRELPESFDNDALAKPASVVPHRGYFIVCFVVLAFVLVGYFLVPLIDVEPYVIAFAGAGALALTGALTRRVRFGAIRELAWGVFPFVIGLFIAVRGLENLGIVAAAHGWLDDMKPGTPGKLLAVAGATGLASNLMNNLPAALLARSVLLGSHAHAGSVLAALIGADIGPMITPFGSLATMLVLALASRAGERIRTSRMIVLGLSITPVVVVAATLALAATFAFVP